MHPMGANECKSQHNHGTAEATESGSESGPGSAPVEAGAWLESLDRWRSGVAPQSFDWDVSSCPSLPPSAPRTRSIQWFSNPWCHQLKFDFLARQVRSELRCLPGLTIFKVTRWQNTAILAGNLCPRNKSNRCYIASGSSELLSLDRFPGSPGRAEAKVNDG
ncbi:hypothetical protein VTK26DRAFT_9116 [Humicola hyalothermophila]